MKKLLALIFCSLLSTSIFSQVPSYVPTSRLQAWWSFSGNANDLSGNNYHGTVHGATLTTDRHNNSNSAYYFDGNDWIDIGDIDSLNPRLHSMTVSAWVKTTSAYCRIYSKGSHGGSQPGYAIMFYPGAGGKNAVIFSPGGHEHNADRSNSPNNDDTWHMVTGVYNRDGNIQLYIDGVLQTLSYPISHDATVDIAANTYNATIGASYCDNWVPNVINEFFVGKIDEVGVWRRALTQCEITQLYNESLFPAITVNNGSICQGQSFTITPSGASTYTIQGGNSVVSPTTSSTYTVIGTNSLGCVVPGFATSSVTVNALPNISVNSGSFCTGNSFTIVPNGANTYTIQGGSAVVSPTVNTSYTVVGTSTAGCISANTATSNVTVNITPTVSVNSGTICSGNTFTIIPSGANTYTIQGGSANVTPSANASYTVIGTSSLGCISANTATSNITVNITPTVVVNSGTICSGNTFTIIPSGASTYTIQGGSASVTPSANASYTVIGTSSLGCVSANTATSNVTVNTTPTVSVNSGTICSGNTFTIIPSGASTYTIQGGTNTVTPLSNASYTVKGTSTVGCLSANTATSNVIVNTTPNVSVNSGTICSGNTFIIIPSGANTYTIQGGSANVTPSANASYTVIGTSSLGCVSANTATSNVTVNTNPTVVVNSGTICSGNTFTIVPSGASTYTIQGGSANVTPTANASYTVIGTSSLGCVSANTATSNVTVNSVPTIFVNSGAICSGNSFTIFPSGASTYTYSGGSAVVSPTATAAYTVTGTNTVGCNGSAVSNVTVNALPTVNAASSNTAFICVGSSATLTASGANTYVWNTTATTAVIAISPTTTTSYTVTGTNAAGCSANAVITQSVSTCTGINSNFLNPNSNFIVYPNPSSGVFNVQLETSTPLSPTTIEVTDALGRVILTDNVNAGVYELNLGNNVNGIYFIKATFDGKTNTVKIVKE